MTRRRVGLMLSIIAGAMHIGGAAQTPQQHDPEDHPTPIREVIVAAEDAARLPVMLEATWAEPELLRDGSVRIRVTAEQLATMNRAGLSWRSLDPADAQRATMCSDVAAVFGWDCYPTYDQYVTVMESFATDYPALCALHDIGDGNNQIRPHDLLLLQISDNVSVQENEPEVLYTASMHGDETLGYVLTLRLAHEILSRYGTDATITNLVDSLEIWINPLANPDGAFASSDSSIAFPTRYYTTTSGQATSVDPNRNFPDPYAGAHPDGNAWWPETIAMMQFAEDHTIALSASIHGGAEHVNYPMDTWWLRHPDDTWYQHICIEYATLAQEASATHPTDPDPSYLTQDLGGVVPGVVHGHDWYRVAGGRQDYLSWWHGCQDVTLELSYEKTLPANELRAHWDYNEQALMTYLENAWGGIHGAVTSASDGTPADATVQLIGHDTQGFRVPTDPDVGDYHRLTLPGMYAMHVTAPGHAPALRHSVVVPDSDSPTVTVDIALEPASVTDLAATVLDATTGAGVDGALVELPATGVTQTTDPTGELLIAATPTGAHAIIVSAPGYVPATHYRVLASPLTAVTIALLPVTWGSSFESDHGGLLPQTGWEWGETTGAGAPGSHSGSRVWATNLDGAYDNDMEACLTTPSITLPSGASSELRYWQWIETECSAWRTRTCYDGGVVEVSVDGAPFDELTPSPEYRAPSITVLDAPGFAGIGGRWHPVSIDLSPYAGQPIAIRWRFASNQARTALGWYLDDVWIAAAGSESPGFLISTTETPTGAPVSFQDLTTGTPLAWSWSFGDGHHSAEQNPVHIYSDPGVYTPRLTVTYADREETVSASDAVTVACAVTFAGLDSAVQPAIAIAAIDLEWVAAESTCDGPISYEVWISTPGSSVSFDDPPTLTGLETLQRRAFGLTGGAEYETGVRACAGVGPCDDNTVTMRITTTGHTSGETDSTCAGGSASVTAWDLAQIVAVLFGAPECSDPGFALSDVDASGGTDAGDLASECLYLGQGLY